MSVMDVQIEPQIQLLSRLRLSVDSQSRLCFLHGVSGVGKSYVANLLAEQLNHHCIGLSYQSTKHVTPIKQQLICELAGEELIDLNQPLLDAIEQRIKQYQQSIVIVIDNASDVPQSEIAMLWHSVHDYARSHSHGPSFNIILIGESNWAMPLFKALDKKEFSFVAEFNLKALSKDQAKAFLMEVHSQWSGGQIENFLTRLRPEHLLPKHLVFASLENPTKPLNKKLLLILSIVFAILVLVLAIGAYLGTLEVKNADTLRDMPIVMPVEVSVEPPVQTMSIPEDKINELEIADNSPELGLNKPLQSIVTPSEPTIVQSDTLIEVPQQTEPLIALLAPAIELAIYDEVHLLTVPKSHYSLMLGGYSERSTLVDLQAKLADFPEIYQYVTIRNGKPWYVLLYGSFATRQAADKLLLALPSQLAGFSPWPKPFTSIHQEIAAFASTKTE